MKDSEKTIVKELTSKELNSFGDDDPEKPSLVVVVVLEALEWCFWGGLIFIFVMFLKPIWQPVWQFFSSSSN